MNHWYTQGQLGAERRHDLDREAATEALRSAARAAGGPGTGSVEQLGVLDRLANLFRHRPAASGIHR